MQKDAHDAKEILTKFTQSGRKLKKVEVDAPLQQPGHRRGLMPPSAPQNSDFGFPLHCTSQHLDCTCFDQHLETAKQQVIA